MRYGELHPSGGETPTTPLGRTGWRRGADLAGDHRGIIGDAGADGKHCQQNFSLRDLSIEGGHGSPCSWQGSWIR